MQSLWFHVTGFQTYLDLIFISCLCTVEVPKSRKTQTVFQSSEFRVITSKTTANRLS